MNVAELKAELENFGDHLEVLAEDSKGVLMPIARAATEPDRDGVIAVVLELE